MNIDLIIGGIILAVVLIYVLIRYIEERKKYEKNYIPMLLSYLEKYQEEQKEFEERAENFKFKLKQAEENLKKIKNNIHIYQWRKKDIERLKQLKGTEFETVFTGIFEILGYNLTEPYIYKDNNIDYIINLPNKKICIDFVDYKKINDISTPYINQLVKGKEKYQCNSVWLITNTEVNNDIKKLLLEHDINIISLPEIIRFFPSVKVFDDYFNEKTVYHNYELLYKETYDEIIRRNEWIDEISKKLEEATKKEN